MKPARGSEIETPHMMGWVYVIVGGVFVFPVVGVFLAGISMDSWSMGFKLVVLLGVLEAFIGAVAYVYGFLKHTE